MQKKTLALIAVIYCRFFIGAADLLQGDDGGRCLQLQVHELEELGQKRFFIVIQHSDVRPHRLPNLHLQHKTPSTSIS